MEERARIDPPAGDGEHGFDDDSERRRVFEGPPEDVLERVSADFRALMDTVVARVRERAVLLDLPSLMPRSAARFAYRAAEAAEAPDLDAWMASCVDDAIDDSLAHDKQDVVLGNLALSGADDTRVPFIVSLVGSEPGLVLEGVVRFNSLPKQSRLAFLAVFVEQRTLADCVESGMAVDKEEMSVLLKQALHAFDPDGLGADRPIKGRGGR